jgi:hypothetical protein
VFTLITLTDESFAIETLYCKREAAEKHFEACCAQSPAPIAVFLYGASVGIVNSKTGAK